MSQQVLRRSKDRRLGLDPNIFSDGQWTDAEEFSRLGLETNSFSVGRRTDDWELSQIGLEPNIFAVGQRTDVRDSIRLGLESIDSSRLGLESIKSFGHILCKEAPCLTVLGTRELTPIKNCTCINCGSIQLFIHNRSSISSLALCTSKKLVIVVIISQIENSEIYITLDILSLARRFPGSLLSC